MARTLGTADVLEILALSQATLQKLRNLGKIQDPMLLRVNGSLTAFYDDEFIRDFILNELPPNKQEESLWRLENIALLKERRQVQRLEKAKEKNAKAEKQLSTHYEIRPHEKGLGFIGVELTRGRITWTSNNHCSEELVETEIKKHQDFLNIPKKPKERGFDMKKWSL